MSSSRAKGLITVVQRIKNIEGKAENYTNERVKNNYKIYYTVLLYDPHDTYGTLTAVYFEPPQKTPYTSILILPNLIIFISTVFFQGTETMLI